MPAIITIPDSRKEHNDKLCSQLRTDCFEYRKISNPEVYEVEGPLVKPHPDHDDLDLIEFLDDSPVSVKFEPIATPWNMIQSGVFGRTYFGNCRTSSLFEVGLKARNQLPDEWFFDYNGVEDRPDWKSNKFGTKAGFGAQWWMEKHLIDEIDKCGWFEWYCHYFLGRRIPQVDKRQILRWFSFKERHTRMALSEAARSGRGELTPRYRQSLYQWSVNPYPDE